MVPASDYGIGRSHSGESTRSIALARSARWLSVVGFMLIACAPPVSAITHHRSMSEACGFNAAIPNGTPIICTNNADCLQSSPSGATCQLSSSPTTSQCSYDACVQDSDCPSDGVCLCQTSAVGNSSTYHPVHNACVTGNCRTDADCPNTGCSPSDYGPAPEGTVVGYYCHTAHDECVNDNDCRPSHVCVFSSSVSHWACSSTSIVRF